MKSVCFVSGSSPDFLGGVSLYQKNLIKYAKDKKLKINFRWIYAGYKDREYDLDEISCIEIKCCKYPILKDFDFARRIFPVLINKNFDILNTHANWGYFLSKYKKKGRQKIIHTYHGVTYPYMKIQFARFGIFRHLLYPLLPFIYLLEKPPIKKADRIICVSEKVRLDLMRLYGTKRDIEVIRTGVDLEEFRVLDKKECRKKLRLDEKRVYGLYSGRGGYWNKGLDRAVELSREIYKKDKNYRLIVIGADEKKCERYLGEEFVVYRGLIDRGDVNNYYSACDFFFSLSRYEGGAPTLALSEAVACGCLAVCSNDSKPEIFKDGEDCLILKSYGRSQAQIILDLLKDEKKIIDIKKSSKRKLKKISSELWGKKYFEVLLDEKRA